MGFFHGNWAGELGSDPTAGLSTVTVLHVSSITMRQGMRAAEAVGAIAVGHAVFPGAGMANAVAARAPARPATPAPAAAHVVDAVNKMYSGGGVDAAAFTDDVSFTDPAASCQGRLEVTEAFRALKAARPEPVQPPLAMASTDAHTTEFYLYQRYLRGFTLLPNGFEIKSVLVVRTSPADGRICALEERWNGAPLLWYSPFRFVRRVNGIISSLLTPRVV